MIVPDSAYISLARLILKRAYTEKRTIKHAASKGLKYLGKEKVGGKIQIKWLDVRA